MATNEPLVPSMILRSRTTNALSNVTEQKACKRSFSLLSSMSLIRTSVITTVVLLYSVAHSNATLNDEHIQSFQSAAGLGAGGSPLLLLVAQLAGQPQGVGMVAAQGEHRAAAAAHRRPGASGFSPEARQAGLEGGDFGT